MIISGRKEYSPLYYGQFPMSREILIYFLLKKTSIIPTLSNTQGHPMDLFLKISVLQAHFCWLGDVEEIIVLERKVLLGKRYFRSQRGFEV